MKRLSWVVAAAALVFVVPAHAQRDPSAALQQSTAQLATFSYRDAAETYETIARDPSYAAAVRKDAATNAANLRSLLGDRDHLRAMTAIALQLQPTQAERVALDYLLADFDFRRWNATLTDHGDDQAARALALKSLDTFFGTHRYENVAMTRNVEAAARIARIKRATGNAHERDWLALTVASWKTLAAVSPASADAAPFADYAAEAEYRLIDQDITAHPPSISCSPSTYKQAVIDADSFDDRLRALGTRYKSAAWVASALARRGSLYEALSSTLYACSGPAFRLFTPQRQATLAQRAAMQPASAQQQPVPAGSVRSPWQAEMDLLDELIVRYYLQAITLAAAFDVQPEAVSRARRRLSYWARIIDSWKLRGYVNKTADPVHWSRLLDYRDNMFALTGLPGVLPPNGTAPPAPVP